MFAFYLGDIMNKFMEIAFKEAKKSTKHGDVPVGAVIVENEKIIAKAHNTKEKTKLVTRHAEINAVEKACKKKQSWYLNECIMYVTLEPCKMCIGAIEHARIKKIIYAAPRKKKESLKTPIMIQGEGIENSGKLLKSFFKKRRK